MWRQGRYKLQREIASLTLLRRWMNEKWAHQSINWPTTQSTYQPRMNDRSNERMIEWMDLNPIVINRTIEPTTQTGWEIYLAIEGLGQEILVVRGHLELELALGLLLELELELEQGWKELFQKLEQERTWTEMDYLPLGQVVIQAHNQGLHTQLHT